jgi:DNA-binding MarR family transcriptional regulator
MKMNTTTLICKKTSRAATNMTKPFSFIDDYLAYLLARSSHLVSEQFHHQIQAQGWSTNYWRILASLSDEDGLTLTQLNQRVLFKQPTLSKLVVKMEAEKLLIRHKDDADKRAVKITISSKGRTLIADLLAQAKAHEKKVLADYSEEQQQLLKSMLRRLVVHLQD